MERRLAAILALDVVGYSRLMRANEADTLAVLKAHRKEIIDPKATQYGGRTIKLMGDGVLLEFGSVVDAVTFAVEIQHAFGERNSGLPDGRQVRYRIGINIGDVIVEGDDIYGDGVNIAARLEGLAEPGGICISSAVHAQVVGKIDLVFEDLGEQQVKNIAEPVTVHRVVLDEKAAAFITPVVAPAAAARRRSRPVAAAAAVVCFLVVAGVLWWRPWSPDVEPANVGRLAFALPDKPSVAVLPFDNLSDDPQQEYFVDGLTDDLITDLSKISGLFVIARNSTFAYKGTAVTIRQVAEDLGVQYVVEGSVRRSSDEVRINAQLIDAFSGRHVWAERYDGPLGDIFDLQDKVVGQIVSALAVSLTDAEQVGGGAETAVVEAYDAFLRGLELYHRFTPESHKSAITHFERAIELDPDYGRAYAGLAAVYWSAIEIGWEVTIELDLPWQQIFDSARDYLSKALEHPSPLAYRVSAQLLLHNKRFDEAVGEIDKAISLDPNDADSYASKSEVLVRAGDAEVAETAARTAMRLNPNYRASYLHALGRSLFGQQRFGEAVEVLERALSRDPESHNLEDYYLAAAYGHLGRTEEAEAAVQRYNESSEQIGWESLTLGYIGRWITYKNEADVERLREGLRLAGVPEGAAPLAEEEEFLQLVSEDSSGFDVVGAIEIDAATARTLFHRGVVFIDVRSAGHFREGHIPGSVHLDLYTALSPENLGELVAVDDEVVFYCFGESCYRSAHACAKALTWGFARVYYFAGGYPAWKEAGYPVENE